MPDRPWFREVTKNDFETEIPARDDRLTQILAGKMENAKRREEGALGGFW
jgi:hypothetical protein